MKNIAIRNVDQELAEALKRQASANDTSLNSIILTTLKQGLGLNKPKFRERRTDLDDLAGTWSDRDLQEFESATDDFSHIDADLWK